MPEERVFNADVLVVGGGLAGIFAAVKAREQGAAVTLVVKGSIGRSGQSPWAHGTMVVPPDREDKINDLMNEAHIGGEYINNPVWTERVIRESYARFQDMLDWGQPFLTDDNGDIVRPVMGGRVHDGRLWAPGDGPNSFIQSFRNYLQQMDIQVLERIMIVDLIKQDGAVIGAVGIATDDWDLRICKAKATVICTGAGGFKPVGGWPIGDLTADGQIMAYQAGAEITGKEFEDFHSGMIRRFGGLWLSPSPFPTVDAKRQEIKVGAGIGMGFVLDFAAHAGRAPIYKGEDEVFSNAAPGMSVHTAEGVWPVDEHCSAGIAGLYVAGDGCATMVTGAAYSLGGSGTANASVTGARAGTAAALYAREAVMPEINESNLALLKEAVRLPAQRSGGFSPGWVTQLLKNMTMPYFVLRIKHGDRLQAALTMVEFMRDKLCPLLFAGDPHELRLAHETRNMVINAEMRLRASLYRTESRGMHYREDYPQRSDPDWRAWVMIKKVDGKMSLYKKPVPQKWQPDKLLREKDNPGDSPAGNREEV